MLVTGAGGSIGSVLAERLAAAGTSDLVLLESHEPSLFHLRNRIRAGYPEVPCRFALGDIRDERRLAGLFAAHRPQIVFHLAAYKQVPLGEENVDQCVSTNVVGTLGLLRQAAAAGVEAIVYPSTDKAVNPPSVYGATKRVVELAAAEWQRDGRRPAVRVVRLVNVFGTQGSVVEVLSRQLLAGQPMTITHPEMDRYWITMDEATLFIAQAASADLARGILLLDLGPAVRTEEIARRLAAQLRPGEPVEIKYVGVRPGERLHEELAYPYEEVLASPYPGILELRDRDGDARVGVMRHMPALAEEVYTLGSAELRRRVFDLAGAAGGRG